MRVEVSVMSANAKQRQAVGQQNLWSRDEWYDCNKSSEEV